MCETIQRTLENKTSSDTKTKLYLVMAVSAFSYASETWTITGKDKRLIQTAERNEVFKAGERLYKLRDGKGNGDVRAN